MRRSLILNHLYSRSLNIYGDLGNIIALKHLFPGLEIITTEIGTARLSKADIYFIGGGQDKDQLRVYKDLLRHKKQIAEEVAADKVFLLVCGGLQLFGRTFVDGLGNEIEGLGILDMETRAPNYEVKSRCVGNIVVEMSKEFIGHWGIDRNFSKYLVGFENHGGQTVFNKVNEVNKVSNSINPIGKVIKGFGNNTKDKIEGAWVGNIIGTYLHGSLLPKNPHLAQAILRKGYYNKYASDLKFAKNLELEKKAHDAAIRML